MRFPFSKTKIGAVLGGLATMLSGIDDPRAQAAAAILGGIATLLFGVGVADRVGRVEAAVRQLNNRR